MNADDLGLAPDPESIVANVVDKASSQPEHVREHGESMGSVREASYRGHRIVIRTTYQIEVDGRPIQGHMGVTNDGQVYYHGVPNVGFASAVDLVKQLIDTFPDDFDGSPDGHSHGTDGARDHSHDQES